VSRDLLVTRVECRGHEAYGQFRCAAELLTPMLLQEPRSEAILKEMQAREQVQLYRSTLLAGQDKVRSKFEKEMVEAANAAARGFSGMMMPYR